MPKPEEDRAGVVAAVRRFPANRQAIEELILRDGDFRDMCDELAEAEEALRAAQDLPWAVRGERIIEWTASIDRLAFEMARALREANVVRVGWVIHPNKRR